MCTVPMATKAEQKELSWLDIPIVPEIYMHNHNHVKNTKASTCISLAYNKATNLTCRGILVFLHILHSVLINHGIKYCNEFDF